MNILRTAYDECICCNCRHWQTEYSGMANLNGHDVDVCQCIAATGEDDAPFADGASGPGLPVFTQYNNSCHSFDPTEEVIADSRAVRQAYNDLDRSLTCDAWGRTRF